MANHKSALKRVRQDKVRKARNRYYHKTMRNALKKFRELTVEKEASTMFPSITSMIDKLAKKNVIHKNKASNLKSKMTKHLNTLKKAS